MSRYINRANRIIPSHPKVTQMRSNSSAPASNVTNNLPRLPVPPLRKTLDRYLKSIEPFLLEDEANGGQPFSESYALRAKWADEFEQGIGKECQERLIALDKRSPHNWLDDNFWLDKAYLEWRAPLLVNSNWWLVFTHDKTVPQELMGSKGITPWQVRRAAWLAHRTLQYRQNIAEAAAPDNTRTGIWLRESVARVFSVCRIPQKSRDTLAFFSPSSSEAAQSILVSVHNWFYLIRALDQGKILSVQDIESQLRVVVYDATQRRKNGETAPYIGALSADDRDRWAENLSYLTSLTERNRRTHEAMSQTLMAISLDDTTHTVQRPPSNSSFDPTHPDQLELDAHLHAIRSTPHNVSNRFFDKGYTIIVDPSGRAGAMGEHSPVDALVPSIVGEYSVVDDINHHAFDEPISPVAVESWWSKASTTCAPSATRLDWYVDQHMMEECDKARNRAVDIVNGSDDSVLWFRHYGTDWVKQIANLAPDAYIQQALQLAWYRTRGTFTATYETALTRMFKHGRTETIRTHTKDSREWVLSMDDSRQSVAQRAALLRRAIRAHSVLTREAATGSGVDRHLMGLQLLCPPQSGPPPRLLADEVFQRSASWKLSTSGLSAGYLFRGTGFGAQYTDGYGINYLAAPDMIKFGIESKAHNPLTSTPVFQEAVINALQDMKRLFDHQESFAEPNRLLAHL